MTFIARHGLVQYEIAQQKIPLWGICEWCPPEETVLDHCHKHGWVRGEICVSHNGRMRQIDAGVSPDRWRPWMVSHWRRCPDCAAQEVREPSTGLEPVRLDLLIPAF